MDSFLDGGRHDGNIASLRTDILKKNTDLENIEGLDTAQK